MSNCAKIRSSFAAFLLTTWFGFAQGQTPVNRIVHSVDESQVVTLQGNVHPLAQAEFDQGAVSAETKLGRMMLLLEPSAEQQAELDELVAAQHDSESPLYHQWLTPAQYGARFGVSAADLARIASWLQGHGFKIEEIPASNRLIIFSGNAGQVADTFHTEIHNYQVNGAAHIANNQDPQIPSALAGVVSGVVSLHNFRRTSAITERKLIASSATSAAQPLYTVGSMHYLVPADYAVIYDLNSLYNAGTKGTSVSIAIVGRSNINLSDVAGFRSFAGLPANQPSAILVNSNPGLVSGDQDESTLDVEWSGAVAPAATVKFVVAASTATSDGVDLSAQYIVNNATAPIVSTSYGSCEAGMGTTELNFYNSLWEQAAAQGISSFVSSGDSGAAGCYSGSATTASGTAVNGLCSSPYSTCVGGTEFNEGSNTAKYWSSSNRTGYGSALSYIPEEVWNESGTNGGAGLWASGGGASIVYSQPSWQLGVAGTSAANGMRAVPDVAMSASGHDGYVIDEDGSFYVIAGTSAASPSFAGVMALVVQSKSGRGQGNANIALYSLLSATNNPFHATPSGNNSVPGVTGFTASGTAYNLATGLGSVDGALLVSSWGTGTAVSANFAIKASSTSGTLVVGKSTTLTMSVTESGSGKNAVLLTAKAPTGVTVSFSPATITPGTTSTATITVGSTVATGVQNVTITGTDASGSLSVSYALTVEGAPTLTLSQTAVSSTISIGQGYSNTVGFSAATGGSFAGSISYTIANQPTGLTAQWSANPTATLTGTNTVGETLTLTASSTLAVGSHSITVTAAGDGLTSAQTVTVQIIAPGVQLAASPSPASMHSAASTTITITATPFGGVTIPTGATGSTISIASGLPTGITAAWSAASVTTAGAVSWTLTLTGSASASAGTPTLVLNAKVAGKSGTTYSSSMNLPLTVTLSPVLTVTPASTSITVSQGSTATDVFSFAGNSTYSGTITLSVSGLPSGVTASWNPTSVTLSSEKGSSILTLTATSAAAVAASTITVTATGDGLTVSKQITVQVQTPPGIHLAASPTSVSVQSLSSTTVTVTATPVGGVTVPAGATGSTISIASGLPKGFTATWSAATLSSSGAVAWTLTLTGSATAVASSSTLALNAKVVGKTGATYSTSLSLPMTVTLTPPTLTVTPASSILTVVQGKSITDVFTLAGNSTYSGAVSLKVSSTLPSGVTASWTSASVSLNSAESGSSTLTLSATSAATITSATFTVTVTGDGLTVTKPITVQVQAAPAVKVSLAPATLSMNSSSTGLIEAYTSMVGGLSAPVSLSISGLPTGVTAKFNQRTIAVPGAGSVIITLTGSILAKAGSFTLAITAQTNSGGVSYAETQTLALTVAKQTVLFKSQPIGFISRLQ